MTTKQCDIGLIGLAVMGENLVLNMEIQGIHRGRLQSHDGGDEKFTAGRGKGKKSSGVARSRSSSAR